MKRQCRLSRSTDLQRVRRSSKSFTHPLVSLYMMPREIPGIRLGVVAGRTVGNAVRRNRAKRLLRAAMHDLLPGITSDCDMLLVARASLPGAEFIQVKQALSLLLNRAGLISSSYGG